MVSILIALRGTYNIDFRYHVENLGTENFIFRLPRLQILYPVQKAVSCKQRNSASTFTFLPITAEISPFRTASSAIQIGLSTTLVPFKLQVVREMLSVHGLSSLLSTFANLCINLTVV